MREIKIGGVYKHFKNKYYIVLDIVNNCELKDGDEEYKKTVIYKSLDGEFLTWAMAHEMFVGEVDREKNPDATQKYRFEEVHIDTQIVKESLSTHNMIVGAESALIRDEVLRRDARHEFALLSTENPEISKSQAAHIIRDRLNIEHLNNSQAINFIVRSLY